MSEGDAHGTFQPYDAEGGFIKGDFFFVGCVRCVVGGDTVYRTVSKCLSDDVDICLGSQGWVHFVVCVKGFHLFLGECEVVWAHFASNGCAEMFGLVDKFYRSPGAYVEEMDGAVCFQGEDTIACDMDFLCGAGHSF